MKRVGFDYFGSKSALAQDIAVWLALSLQGELSIENLQVKCSPTLGLVVVIKLLAC